MKPYFNKNKDIIKEEKILINKVFDKVSIGYVDCEMVYEKNGQPTNFRIIHANNGFEKQTGLSIKTILGKTVKEVFPEFDSKWIIKMGQLAQDQKAIQFTKYDSITDKIYDINGFSHAKGKFSLLLNNVSPQKDSEFKFIDCKGFMSVVFNNTRDLQILVEYKDSQTFEVVAVNNAYINKGKQLGIHITKKDLVGKPLKFILSDIIKAKPEDIQKTLLNYKKVIDTNQQLEFIESVPITGTLYHAEVTLTPITNTENGKRYVFYNSHDISKEMKAMQLLQDSEERFSLAVKASNTGIWDWKVLDGDKFWISDRLYEILGYTPGEVEILFSQWKKRIHPEDSKRVLALFNQELKAHTPYQIEFRLKKKNGDYVWIYTRGVSFLDENGKLIRTAGSISDITERKIAQLSLKQKAKEIEDQNKKLNQANKDLLKAKEKVEENDRLKSAFLANMSHEIRTPMNGILGFSRLLKDSSLTKEEQNNYIKIIESAGERMLNIINDIISISKIESGERHITYTNTNIYNQVEFVYNLLHPEAKSKDIKLAIIDYIDNKDLVIKTDDEKLYAILSNLIKNAIKYTHSGKITIGYSKKGEFLEFFVKDTGIGIAKDRQSVIFERFIQADVQNIMARQGAGLGLAISKAFCDMLGGDMWLESEEGVGSTFYFTIPYQIGKEVPEDPEKSITTPAEEFQLKKIKILIAEDDKISTMLISKEMEKYCSEILKAETGIEAVDIFLKNQDIDLILMDIQMPVMNGYLATQQIRQHNKEVVILAQTAFALSGDRDKALVAGCNDYISKPINRTELITMLQKYFTK